jgi:hypothetical protein
MAAALPLLGHGSFSPRPLVLFTKQKRWRHSEVLLSGWTMKTFNVYLRDGRIVAVRADRYRHESNQYVFDGKNDSEVQFFLDCEVTGIIEAIPPVLPMAIPRRPRALDGWPLVGLAVEWLNEVRQPCRTPNWESISAEGFAHHFHGVAMTAIKWPFARIPGFVRPH